MHHLSLFLDTLRRKTWNTIITTLTIWWEALYKLGCRKPIEPIHSGIRGRGDIPIGAWAYKVLSRIAFPWYQNRKISPWRGTNNPTPKMYISLKYCYYFVPNVETFPCNLCQSSYLWYLALRFHHSRYFILMPLNFLEGVGYGVQLPLTRGQNRMNWIRTD